MEFNESKENCLSIDCKLLPSFNKLITLHKVLKKPYKINV